MEEQKNIHISTIVLTILFFFGCSFLPGAPKGFSNVNDGPTTTKPHIHLDTFPKPTIQVDYWDSGGIRAMYLQEKDRQQFFYFSESGQLTQFGQQAKCWVMDSVETYNANLELVSITATGDSSYVFALDGWNIHLNEELDSSENSKGTFYNEGTIDSVFNFKYKLE